jgi:2-polyprenyl-3-methyl-5-hydroxy-6-metoxy-1,4-benzoquinol methylase
MIEAHETYRQRRLAPDRLRVVKQHCGNSILDVGCGNGAYVEYFHRNGHSTFGLDYKAFPTWSKNPNLFKIEDIHKLSEFSDASFDTIICFEVLEHVDQIEEILRNFFRICKKNVIISVPNCDDEEKLNAKGFSYSHWKDQTHINFFKSEEMRTLISKAGFSSVDVVGINKVNAGFFVSQWLLPKVLKDNTMIQKLINKISRNKFNISNCYIAYKI